jgi:hypothetical protein
MAEQLPPSVGTWWMPPDARKNVTFADRPAGELNAAHQMPRSPLEG